MPLTAKGEEIKSALQKEYGEKKGEQVLYAGKNKGTFTGIDAAEKQASIIKEATATFYLWPKGEPKSAMIGPFSSSEKASNHAKQLGYRTDAAMADSTKTLLDHICDSAGHLCSRFDRMFGRNDAESSDKRAQEALGAMSRLRNTFKQGDNRFGEYGRNVKAAYDRWVATYKELTGKSAPGIYD
jgi:hypothetical protein